MNPKREDEIFADALGLSGDERAAWLERACGGDPALRARVEALLGFYDHAGNFLEGPVDGFAAPPPDEQTGDAIGRYTLIRKLGEGGCGTVYLAEQKEPVRRQVALKVIKLGMDTRQVIARFEGERQALAMMDHPDIARVFDAGATDAGRPFFVMEFVAGVPITKFCDEHSLPVAARLELFARVCLALQHAHQKGVIHRDIKPSNILVARHDGVPTPKVIDFGIAKAMQDRLTEHTLVTGVDQFLGTPAYVSPEQADLRDLDIDTRSDVYALGVLLYELLTSRLPFDPKTLVNAGVDQIRRIIREVEPPRPSQRFATLVDADRATAARLRGAAPVQLASTLRGDLDWIVMRCLEKDRDRRYSTAQELADDVRRHLRDEPVEARPPTTAYRVERFVTRHRLACASAAAIALTLVVATAVSVRQAVRATRAEHTATGAERTARNEAAVAAAVNDFIVTDLLRQADSSVQADAREAPNPDLKVREALDRAAQKVGPRFEHLPLAEAAVRSAIGESYLGIGLGAKAEPHLRRARQLRHTALGPEHPDTLAAGAILARACADQGKFAEAAALQTEVLAAQTRVLGADSPVPYETMNDLADTYDAHGKYAEAATLQARALAHRQQALGPEHPDTLLSMSNLGNTDFRLGKYDEAFALQSRALEARKRVLGPEHPATLNTMNNLATTLEKLGKPAEAEALQVQTLEIVRRVLGPEHSQTIGAMLNLAATGYRQGKYAEAEALQVPALEIARRALGPEHPYTLTAMNNLARTYGATGKKTEAAALLEQSRALVARVFGPEHPNALASTLGLGRAYVQLGKFAEAAALLDPVCGVMERVLGADHPYRQSALEQLAVARTGLGQPVEVIALRRQILEIKQRTLGAEHPQTISARALLATDLLGQKDYAEAESLLRAVVSFCDQKFPDEWTTFSSRSALGGALAGLKRFPEAEPLLAAGYEGMKQREAKIPVGARPRLKEALERLVQFYTDSGQPGKVADWRQRLAELEPAENLPAAQTR